jgi:hypothetical protein
MFKYNKSKIAAAIKEEEGDGGRRRDRRAN